MLKEEQLILGQQILKVRYCCNTDSKRLWVVFIPPFGLKLDSTSPIFESLSESCNLVTWESRCVFNDDISTPNELNVTIEDHVADLVYLLHYFDISKATLIGYCSGAGIALKAAYLYPTLFDKLILVHGEYTLIDKPDCLTQVGRDVEGILPLAAQDFKVAQLILEKIKSNFKSRESATPIGVDEPYKKDLWFYKFANCYVAYKQLNYLDLARQIETQTLVMTGAKDVQTNMQSSEEIHECLRNSNIFIDETADHYGVLRSQSSTLQKIKSELTSNAF